MDSPTEILIVLVIAMVLFGPTRLPKLARSMGEAMKELKSGFASGTSGPVTGGPEVTATGGPEVTATGGPEVTATGGPEVTATSDAESSDQLEEIPGDIESVSDVG
jgi:sec-independent protein translocase protein TatA